MLCNVCICICSGGLEDIKLEFCQILHFECVLETSNLEDYSMLI